MKGVGMAALLAAALFLSACGGEDDAGGSSGQSGEAAGGGQTVTVVAQDFSFDTTNLEFEPGAQVTVTLDNQGEAEHTFSIEELDVEAEAAGGETAEATFTMPDSGSFEFFCEYHPEDMTGTLGVIGATSGGGTEKKDDEGGGDTDTGSGAGGY